MNTDRFKFRYWNGSKMIYNVYVGEGAIILPEHKNPLLIGESIAVNIDEAVKRGLLMQCTGLKDKNYLTLLYEGDLLQDKYKESIVFVTFRDGSFRVQYPKKVDNIIVDQLLDKSNIELLGYTIIGNVFENKNLLEGK